MSYNAKVFNVMTASPNDTFSERAIVRQVVYEWNMVHSMSRQLVLLPIGWETHSSPEVGETPQSILNRQILADCDLLVAIFWTRLGTPTEDFDSGSVEEIERHVEAKKPVMIYFSAQPVALDSVDPDQYARLKSFKEACKARSLYEEFNGQNDFKEKFTRHLQLKLNKDKLFEPEKVTQLDERMILATSYHSNISLEARTLLKEASLDKHGIIILARSIGGTHLQTNGKNLLGIEANARQAARWEAALSELHNAGLIAARGHKGDVYQITDNGYKYAETIVL